MAYPLPSTASFATVTPLRHEPDFPAAVSLLHLKHIHAHLLRNPHIPNHRDGLMHLLLSSLSFPSYALSLLSSNIYDRPLPIKISSQLFKCLFRSDNPWNALIFFQTMHNKAFPLDRCSVPSLLRAAAKTLALSEGKMIHGLAAKLGYVADPYVETALVDMYAACGLISEARIVFDRMPERDSVVWNTMIAGYCKSMLFDDAFALLEEMKSSNTEPNQRLFTAIISACNRFENWKVGKVVHGLISENNIVIDSHLQRELLSLYASCGAMDIAQSLYDKFPSKNVWNSTTMICELSKVGNLEAARFLFDEMVDKDLICWSAMISGYADSDKPQEALKVFQDMQRHGIKPNQVTMLNVISACAHLGALDQAKKIHLFVDDEGFGKDLFINTSLIDMYTKCGSLEDAKRVFGRMHRKNVVSWTSMISAFAVHGEVDNALKYFQQMKSENVDPNSLTFVSVLNACIHAGLVEEGKRAFDSMVNDYGITPLIEHYGYLVDLYSRANHLKDALKVVKRMPVAPDVFIWGSLMAASIIHDVFELGKFVAQRLLELDPDNYWARVFLLNVVPKEIMWENIGAIRQPMKFRGISKERECSRIEMNNEILEFFTADRNHKTTDDIYAKLDEVVDKLEKVGYRPSTSGIMVDLDEDGKREVVLRHSEKLALCYGLVSGERQSCIRIVKNVRMCVDCHNFMKLASKVFDKEIVIRDEPMRFHYFRDGLCSCTDY